MQRLLVLAFLAMLVAPALAQSPLEAADKDLWCGLAFTKMQADAAPDASDELKALVARYSSGAEMLLERAKAAYLRAGLGEEGFAARRAALEPEANPDATGRYSYEDCAALIGY